MAHIHYSNSALVCPPPNVNQERDSAVAFIRTDESHGVWASSQRHANRGCRAQPTPHLDLMPREDRLPVAIIISTVIAICIFVNIAPVVMK